MQSGYSFHIDSVPPWNLISEGLPDTNLLPYRTRTKVEHKKALCEFLTIV